MESHFKPVPGSLRTEDVDILRDAIVPDKFEPGEHLKATVVNTSGPASGWD